MRHSSRLLSLGLAAMLGLSAWLWWDRPLSRRDLQPAPLVHRVDVTRADAATLELLPGIGPSLAERIIEYREQGGALAGPADLERIRGIGPATRRKIEPWVRFGGEPD
ncbi:MAG: ComEA family DNA-binding protein [Phycisphaeraceae bacterium]